VVGRPKTVHGPCLHRVRQQVPRRPAAPLERRHGPPEQTTTDGDPNGLTCRRRERRRAPAAKQHGGTLHVLLGGSAATHDVVLFVIFPQRWSFLSMNWGRWSLLSKFHKAQPSRPLLHYAPSKLLHRSQCRAPPPPKPPPASPPTGSPTPSPPTMPSTSPPSWVRRETPIVSSTPPPRLPLAASLISPRVSFSGDLQRCWTPRRSPSPAPRRPCRSGWLSGACRSSLLPPPPGMGPRRRGRRRGCLGLTSLALARTCCFRSLGR
jgi:hypothetical protein